MVEGKVQKVVCDATAAMMTVIIGELALDGTTVRALSVEVKITTPTPEGRPDRVQRYVDDYTAK